MNPAMNGPVRTARAPRCVALLLLGACSLGLSRTAPEKLRFVAAPDPGPPQPATAEAVLEVRPLYVHRTWAGRPFVRLGDDGAVTADFYHEWFVAPAEMVHDALLAWTERRGVARAVVAPGSRIAPTHALECDLLVFGGTGGAQGPAGEVSLRAMLLRDGIVATKEFQARTPLAGDEPAAFAAAIEQALGRVLDELCGWARAELVRPLEGR
jgi:ABC-type uncharacterized transport system auxiliary subunit